MSSISLGITSKSAADITIATTNAFTEYQIEKLIRDSVGDLHSQITKIIEKNSFVCSMIANLAPAVGAAVENSIAIPTIDVIQIYPPEKDAVVRRAQHGALGRKVGNNIKGGNINAVIQAIISDPTSDEMKIAIAKTLKTKQHAFVDAITADEVI